ncbi:hypothetical protein DFJ73DRAFT_860400 [Zopfochytrium polystomum]|nr:hypothetical protein DFJ73DRAFT_860400 [Zopfochytrium polystomum]
MSLYAVIMSGQGPRDLLPSRVDAMSPTAIRMVHYRPLWRGVFQLINEPLAINGDTTIPFRIAVPSTVPPSIAIPDGAAEGLDVTHVIFIVATYWRGSRDVHTVTAAREIYLTRLAPVLSTGSATQRVTVLNGAFTGLVVFPRELLLSVHQTAALNVIKVADDLNLLSVSLVLNEYCMYRSSELDQWAQRAKIVSKETIKSEDRRLEGTNIAGEGSFQFRMPRDGIQADYKDELFAISHELIVSIQYTRGNDLERLTEVCFRTTCPTFFPIRAGDSLDSVPPDAAEPSPITTDQLPLDSSAKKAASEPVLKRPTASKVSSDSGSAGPRKTVSRPSSLFPWPFRGTVKSAQPPVPSTSSSPDLDAKKHRPLTTRLTTRTPSPKTSTSSISSANSLSSSSTVKLPSHSDSISSITTLNATSPVSATPSSRLSVNQSETVRKHKSADVSRMGWSAASLPTESNFTWKDDNEAPMPERPLSARSTTSTRYSVLAPAVSVVIPEPVSPAAKSPVFSSISMEKTAPGPAADRAMQELASKLEEIGLSSTCATAIKGYSQSGTQELTVTVGDSVQISNINDVGLAFGLNTRTGLSGWIPLSVFGVTAAPHSKISSSLPSPLTRPLTPLLPPSSSATASASSTSSPQPRSPDQLAAPQPSNPPKPAAAVSALADVAVFAFEARDADELDVNPGDYIIVGDVEDDGWAWGRNETTQKKGFFPLSVFLPE